MVFQGVYKFTYHDVYISWHPLVLFFAVSFRTIHTISSRTLRYLNQEFIRSQPSDTLILHLPNQDRATTVLTACRARYNSPATVP